LFLWARRTFFLFELAHARPAQVAAYPLSTPTDRPVPPVSAPPLSPSPTARWAPARARFLHAASTPLGPPPHRFPLKQSRRPLAEDFFLTPCAVRLVRPRPSTRPHRPGVLISFPPPEPLLHARLRSRITAVRTSPSTERPSELLFPSIHHHHLTPGSLSSCSTQPPSSTTTRATPPQWATLAIFPAGLGCQGMAQLAFRPTARSRPPRPMGCSLGPVLAQYCATVCKCFSIVLNYRNCFKLQRFIETCRIIQKWQNKFFGTPLEPLFMAILTGQSC
jgi:hypothetical protein